MFNQSICDIVKCLISQFVMLTDFQSVNLWYCEMFNQSICDGDKCPISQFV